MVMLEFVMVTNISLLIDGRMTCDFMFFLTVHLHVFQSYQDDGWVMMKDCVMEPHLLLKRSPP